MFTYLFQERNRLLRLYRSKIDNRFHSSCPRYLRDKFKLYSRPLVGVVSTKPWPDWPKYSDLNNIPIPWISETTLESMGKKRKVTNGPEIKRTGFWVETEIYFRSSLLQNTSVYTGNGFDSFRNSNIFVYYLIVFHPSILLFYGTSTVSFVVSFAFYLSLFLVVSYVDQSFIFKEVYVLINNIYTYIYTPVCCSRFI